MLHSSRSCNDTKRAKKYVAEIVTCDQIGLLLTNHIIAKYLNFIIVTFFFSESRVYKNWQASAIIRQISYYRYSNLETGRDSPESGVSWIITSVFQRAYISAVLERIYINFYRDMEV